jgi:hypothetical protein
LFSFVDFEKFKKDMLDMKKSIDSTAENTEPSDKLEFSKEKENSISIDEQF